MRSALRTLKARGVKALALRLLWSFLNPAHKVDIERLVGEEWPEVYLTLSRDVAQATQELLHCLDRTASHTPSTLQRKISGPPVEPNQIRPAAPTSESRSVGV